MERRRVLVTGGTGFVGTYTVRALSEAGYEVTAFDLHGYRPEARQILGDLIDELRVDRGSFESWPQVLETVTAYKPHVIVHIAGVMDIPWLDANPYAALTTNVTGTVNLLEAARLNDVERFVFFSSIGVIPRVMYEPIDGNHPVLLSRDGPAWAYSTAKISGELFCYSYQKSYGVDFRVIRPSAVYGFGMSRFAPNGMKNIVEPAVDGVPVRLASGGAAPRDYIYVVDLAELVVASVRGPDDADRIFYGATGRPLTLTRDVASIVRDLVPGADIEIVDEMSDVDREELCCRGVTSIDNAVAQLGWSPQFLDVRDGIADYVNRYRRYRAEG